MGVVATKSRRATAGSPAGADNVALVQLDIATSGRTPAAAAETANITDETLEPPGTAIRTGVARRKAKRTVHMGARIRNLKRGFLESVGSIKHHVNRTVQAVEETVNNIMHTGCPHGGAHAKDAAEHEKCRQDLLHAKKAVARLEEAQNSQKEDDGSDIQGELASLKAENEKLTRRKDELARCEKRLNNLVSELKTSAGDKEAVLKLDHDQELTDLRQRDEEREQALKDLEAHFKMSKEELANKQKDYEQSMEELTALGQRDVKREQELTVLRQRNVEREQEFVVKQKDYKERLEALTGMNAQLKTSQEEELVNKQKDYEQSMQELANKQKDSEQRLGDLTVLRQHDADHLKALTDRNAQLQTSQEVLQTAYNKQSNDYTALSTKLAEKEKEKQKCTSELDAQKEHSTVLDQQIQSCKHELDEKSKAADKDKTKLQDDIKSKADEYSSLEEKMTKLTELTKSHERKVKELERELEAAKLELNTKITEKKGVEYELAKSKEALDTQWNALAAAFNHHADTQWRAGKPNDAGQNKVRVTLDTNSKDRKLCSQGTDDIHGNCWAESYYCWCTTDVTSDGPGERHFLQLGKGSEFVLTTHCDLCVEGKILTFATGSVGTPIYHTCEQHFKKIFQHILGSDLLLLVKTATHFAELHQVCCNRLPGVGCTDIKKKKK